MCVQFDVRQYATVVNDTDAMRNETTIQQPTTTSITSEQSTAISWPSAPPPPIFAVGSANDIIPHPIKSMLSAVFRSQENDDVAMTHKRLQPSWRRPKRLVKNHVSIGGAVSSALAGFSGVSAGFTVHCYVLLLRTVRCLECFAQYINILKIMELSPGGQIY